MKKKLKTDVHTHNQFKQPQMTISVKSKREGAYRARKKNAWFCLAMNWKISRLNT
jgi:hypothetical protein